MHPVLFVVAIAASFLALGSADMYLHSPRGSNNRLNEASANRRTANRVFDSQNNNRGGYNVGDSTAQKAGNDQNKQYRMRYFQSGKYLTQIAPSGRTELVMEWTNQHGCGGNENTDPHKQNCNIVLQYMCQDDIAAVAPKDGITIRAGSSTARSNYGRISSASSQAQFVSRRNSDVRADRGLNEPWVTYDDCTRRQRNKETIANREKPRRMSQWNIQIVKWQIPISGASVAIELEFEKPKSLFSATQNLRNEATSTRQNRNGARSGYECPEERDYFPYWHPTVWTDIAVLAQNESLCSYYVAESFNSQKKGICVEKFRNTNTPRHFSVHNNPQACAAGGGVWTEYESMLELAPQFTTSAACLANHQDGLSYAWGLPYDIAKINAFQPITPVCFVKPPPINCEAAPWSRSNHLGNGREGVPLSYTWTLPYFPSKSTKRCIVRARYNISTDDYDPFDTDATNNGAQSPVQQNPLVSVGGNGQDLRLAINTAQFGRTFQDRSHPMLLAPRPATIPDTAHILNLGVRGKRGNIVQTFPAVEYDFFPTRPKISRGSMIHYQWTGSNSHNNGNPGGDGQTGDAGEGTGGTDRNNLLQSGDPDVNYPLISSKITMFNGVAIPWVASGVSGLSSTDIAVYLASSGYYHCMTNAKCGAEAVDTKAALQNQLNNAPASFPGIVVQYNTAGEFTYLCTRNNNFSNRSQKGRLVVSAT